jgi:phosphohistidine phosphatase
MEPCDLYLVRHAIAAERGDDWPDDSKRPLTETGVNRFKEAVAGLAWMDVTIDEIFTSPLVRAKQTATLLAHGLGNKTSVKMLDALAPGHSPRQVMNGSPRALPFKKGGACLIAIQGLTSRRPGELIWFFPPKVLRRLHR